MNVNQFICAISSIAVVSSIRISKGNGFFDVRPNVFSSRAESRLFAATAETPAKSGLGWDSHKAVDEIPETLVKTIEGNESMRRKFEKLCRESQVIAVISL